MDKASELMWRGFAHELDDRLRAAGIPERFEMSRLELAELLTSATSEGVDRTAGLIAKKSPLATSLKIVE